MSRIVAVLILAGLVAGCAAEPGPRLLERYEPAFIDRTRLAEAGPVPPPRHHPGRPVVLRLRA